jgi:hypothetical protein
VRAGGAVVLRGGDATAADFGQGGAIALTAGAALIKEASNRGGSVSTSAGTARRHRRHGGRHERLCRRGRVGRRRGLDCRLGPQGPVR